MVAMMAVETAATWDSMKVVRLAAKWAGAWAAEKAAR
jgi:hypothetical protein